MNILQIYDAYKLPPNLQEHQLRVAAVGSLITSHWQGEPIPTTDIIQALLLHDMGNMIKFDLDTYATLLGTERDKLEHWKSVQRTFIAKYGQDTHAATVKIAEEVNARPATIQLIENYNANYEEEALNPWPGKIITYADMRVGPMGILSLEERFNDLKVRYRNRRRDTESYLNQKHVVSLEIEQLLQIHTTIQLKKISDADLIPVLKRLKTTTI